VVLLKPPPVFFFVLLPILFPVFLPVSPPLSHPSIRFRGIGVLLRDQEFSSIRGKKRGERAINKGAFINREKPISI
jgi:hypothetical protein